MEIEVCGNGSGIQTWIRVHDLSNALLLANGSRMKFWWQLKISDRDWHQRCDDELLCQRWISRTLKNLLGKEISC